ncbi:MAG: ribonuclease [Parcubacteria group bacterium]|nr:ribonuclease [Parcubacteria group bacterium]
MKGAGLRPAFHFDILQAMQFTLYADGGSRGNPGPAGSGSVVFDSSGKRVVEVADYIGITTNNVAEYEAVLRGLTKLKEAYPEGYFNDVELLIRLDSKLIVEQMKGAYKVKHPNLIPRYLQVKNIIARSFPNVSFEHVRREFNKDADALANQAMDKGA